jgi:hypothetical protein
MRGLKIGVAAIALVTAAGAGWGQTISAVPTPKAVLGHDVGEDYYLANYEEEIAYFHKLAASSDRIKLFKAAGKSTQGRTYEYAVISSPANLAKYEQIKALSKRLADPRGLTDAEAQALAKDGKIIVHIDGGMHASEVADHQLPMALAYKLLSAKGDPEVDKILNDVVLVLWPSLNPDGQDMIVDWYRKHRGTPYETSRMPWLFQEYVGHDNNRDAYMLNMIESRTVNAEEQTYSPVIWYSQHQTAPFPARIWMPPFADPISSNISPYMRIWTNAIGTNMMARFEKEQKPGAIAMARFDNWYPGFLDYIHVFRNTISFFTETAHDSATPKNYDPKDFPANMKDMKAQIWYPHPWKGGEWHLKDSVDYMVTASMSVLETAQKYRETLLYNRYQAGRDAVKLYSTDGPFAYVIPSGQTDMPEAASLAQILIMHGLDVDQLKAPTTIGGKSYPAGSFVVLMAQPFAGLAKELFERQKYPDAILGGDGKPVDLPYDVTGWTLPLQMGVTVDPITTPLESGLSASLVKVDKAEAPAGTVSGQGSTYLLSRQVNDSYKVLNAVLAAGGKGFFTVDAQSIGVSGIDRPALEKLLAANGVAATAVADAPASEAITKARVGLYRPWGSNIDEGWTRWIFEQYGYGPKSLYNTDMKAGLSGKYDTVVLPDINGGREIAAATTAPAGGAAKTRRGPIGSLINGFSTKEEPAEYAGGIGEDGGAALKKFVEDGGTLVAMNNASDAVIDLFDLPVTNILKGVKSDEFFCSGALLEVQMTPGLLATGGMAARPVVMFERGPAFETKPGFQGKVLASYAPGVNPLRSGVLIHPEKIEGKAAALEVQYGKGKIYLYGFQPQWRGQAHGTYKLLFNLLYAR